MIKYVLWNIFVVHNGIKSASDFIRIVLYKTPKSHGVGGEYLDLLVY